MRTAFLLAATTLILAIPAQAKMPWVKKAQEMGFTDVKDCKACHVGMPKKGGDMSARGKFLVDTKAAKQAPEVDLAWLKEYKGK
jgi:cytochrome c peroxidase